MSCRVQTHGGDVYFDCYTRNGLHRFNGLQRNTTHALDVMMRDSVQTQAGEVYRRVNHTTSPNESRPELY
jgi:hypothetical protein